MRTVKSYVPPLSCILVILFCILPMSVNPYWNGEIPGHRDQYEKLAEAFLEGRLYVDKDDADPALLAMENPYDPVAREEAGVSFLFDHAFYDGHYYVYFGVVPAVISFLPYRMLTGVSLDTYHATQAYTAVFLLFMYLFFRLIKRRFSPSMLEDTFVALYAGCAFLSVWYITGAPMLYCTAIAAALMFMMMSVFFFYIAVYEKADEKSGLVYVFLGGLCGALAFGCRPPIALANLIAVPMFFAYSGKDKKKAFVVAAIPYIVTACCLMWYNAARFDNPFEFGQTYQMTVADQHMYGGVAEQFDPAAVWSFIRECFFAPFTVSGSFPFISYGGLFVTFPLLVVVIAVFFPPVYKKLKAEGMAAFAFVLLALPFIIMAADALWSPFFIPRYRTDAAFLLATLSFIACAALVNAMPDGARRKAEHVFILLGMLCMLSSVLLFFVPFDRSLTEVYPEIPGLFPR